MSLTAASTITLNDKRKIPVVGLGVWQIPDGQPTIQAVGWALEAGYRHIDTAKFYANERGVGEGIRRSGVPREKVWVTTKLWPSDGFRPDKALAASLERLGLDYVDLYLVHWPIPGMVVRTWKAMEQLQHHGGARSIGVSNHSVGQLGQLLEKSSLPPAVNQVKLSPFGFDQQHLDFCHQHGIAVEAYSPLTRGRQLDDQRVAGIAGKHHKTPAQVLLRWALQKGTVVLPKSKGQEHIKENLALFDFELGEDDMAALDALSG